MPSDTCMCGHTSSNHGPSGCQVMVPDHKGKGSHQCSCMTFVPNDYKAPGT